MDLALIFYIHCKENDGEIQAKNYFDEDQLYQLENDPFEQSNLYSDTSQKAKIKELKTELKKYLKIVPGTFPID